MTRCTFNSVWDAITERPEDAENLKLRSTLMTALKEHLSRRGLTQSEAAALLGVTQPRISNLMRGKLSLFSIDVLVGMAVAAGLRVELRISEAS